MHELFFRDEEQANTFIEEVNGLGYEWHPVHLYKGKPPYGPREYTWILKYESDTRTAQKIHAFYMGS